MSAMMIAQRLKPAAHTRSPRATPTSAALKSLLDRAREYSFEFIRTNANGTIDPDICNHLELSLISAIELGASDQALQRFYDDYLPRWPLEKCQPVRRPVDQGNWHLHLGDRRYEAEYRQFFGAEVERLGTEGAVRRYLPAFIEGPASSAYHAMIRLSYGCLRGDAGEVALGLAYWAATYLRFPRLTEGKPFTDRPAEALARMRSDPVFRAMPHTGIGLWARMHTMGSEPHFSPVIDWLAVGPTTLRALALDSLALFINTNDMRALHAITGCQALRELLTYLSAEDQIRAMRYLWQAIAALSGLMGFIAPASDEEMNALREERMEPWDRIKAAAALSLDEHDLKVVFVMAEEFKAYGDPLYQLAASRRMKLSPGF